MSGGGLRDSSGCETPLGIPAGGRTGHAFIGAVEGSEEGSTGADNT